MWSKLRIALWSLAVLLGVGWIGGAWAAGEGPLADKHRAAGIECAGCHQEAPPKQLVDSAKCQACHGNAAALAAKTEKSRPNPHDSHQGDIPCESCHHAHRPSVDYCAQCHQFNLRVP